MKFFVAASALLAAGATARVAPTKHVSTLEDSLAVPGENPLFYCEDPSTNNYIIELDSVDLSPNPPESGVNLTITAKGYINEDIEEGAKANVQVKYGVITIVRQTFDLCEAVKNINLECPLKKGQTELTKEIELPSPIPPGKFTVLADVLTKDDKKITCLTAQVEFAKKSSTQKILGGLRESL